MRTCERDVTTEDGRTLRVLEAGAEEGAPIVVHHGTPGSGLLHEAWAQDAAARGARLIGYDRPGYGGSDRQAGRSVVDAAADTVAIADALGLERFATWGASGGGPHALACGALLGDRVAAVGALSSPAPYDAEDLDWHGGMSEENLEEFGLTVAGEEPLRLALAAQAPQLAALDPGTFVAGMGGLLAEPDRAVLTAERAAFLLESLRAGVGERVDGWVDDDLAFVAPWGFAVSDVRVPVLLWSGRQDVMVPVTHAEWIARRLPDVEARLHPDLGHMNVPMQRIGEVHAWLLERLGQSSQAKAASVT
jgi:pimeloyl-ACP methyl ester carboxylesterase